jgi:hypothetical protein
MTCNRFQYDLIITLVELLQSPGAILLPLIAFNVETILRNQSVFSQ